MTVFEFLEGLSKSLNDIKGQILGRTLLPSIQEVFVEMRQEEGRRMVMLGEKNSYAIEVSALISRNNHSNSLFLARANKKGESVV